jgi:hypothetical protein
MVCFAKERIVVIGVVRGFSDRQYGVRLVVGFGSTVVLIQYSVFHRRYFNGQG